MLKVGLMNFRRRSCKRSNEKNSQISESLKIKDGSVSRWWYVHVGAGAFFKAEVVLHQATILHLRR